MIRSGRLGIERWLSIVLTAVLVSGVSACGGDEPDGSTAPTASGGVVEVEVEVAGDKITTANDRVEVNVGQTVHVSVVCDVADEVHVHGFDLSVDLEPNEPGELEFEVTDDPGPGLYEVELEDRGLLLFQLEVR